jgi:hypothetical protein
VVELAVVCLHLWFVPHCSAVQVNHATCRYQVLDLHVQFCCIFISTPSFCNIPNYCTNYNAVFSILTENLFSWHLGPSLCTLHPPSFF